MAFPRKIYWHNIYHRNLEDKIIKTMKEEVKDAFQVTLLLSGYLGRYNSTGKRKKYEKE